MMRTVLRPAIPFAAALVVALAGCGSSDSSSAAGGSAGSAGGGGAGAADGAVTISNFTFKPDPVTVKVGTTVTWTNNDSAAHTAASDSGQGATFDTGNLSQGKSGSYKFDKAGTYKYHCGIHNYMMGTITVTG